MFSFSAMCFKRSFCLQNYNKSRIHSFRGVKDIEIFLDDNLIFRGEMARFDTCSVGKSYLFDLSCFYRLFIFRASGELGSSETFGDVCMQFYCTILVDYVDMLRTPLLIMTC